MESLERTEEQPSKKYFTIFGQRIIQTRCQRDSLFYGIIGGMASGLISFLFTSQPRKSYYIAIGSYAVATLGYGCYCSYQDYLVNEQGCAIQRALYESNLMHSQTESDDKSN